MSDRLEDLRNRHGKPWAYHDQEWALAEIDRLRANGDSLCEKIRALTDENKKLRANHVPGRCGGCGWYRDMICTKHSHWENQVEKEPDGFCDEWKPKE